MLVGERRNGNLLVQLGPTLQAQPEELLRQRWSPGGHTEYLIRWAVQNLEDGAGIAGATSQAESKAPSILMWMSTEEVYTNCPTLLGKRKSEGSELPEEKASRAPDEGALQDMREDVRMLVQRAARQMSQSTGPDSSILNTIHVLSAYASIGSLAGVFKETGALDLLMKMLCYQENQIRKSAGKMLRALASHDAGSRAHVLLSLSQQDGIEQHMDFESRHTLLQLFDETTSFEEHCISFEGIHLPPILGKQLFSLVKRYLCVTSLLDQLHSDQVDHGGKNRLQRQFDLSMAMGSLICELVRVMGWVRDSETGQCRKKASCSIFQGRDSIHSQESLSVKTTNFKKRSDFSSRSSYVEYLRHTLCPGMNVRMLEDYDQVVSGDDGTFRQSKDVTPPVQVYWQSLNRTYWVHWHMLEIITRSGETEKRHKLCDLMESLCVTPVNQSMNYKPSRGMYALPYLTGIASEDPGTLRQYEWWELLFFIRRLEPQEQQEVLEIIRKNQEVQMNEKHGRVSDLDDQGLIQMVVLADVAQKIMRYLREHCSRCVLTDLQSSHVYNKHFLHAEVDRQRSHSGTPMQDSPGGLLSKKPKTDEVSNTNWTMGLSREEKSDLLLLVDLLALEGIQTANLEEQEKVICSGQDARVTKSLEHCWVLIAGIQRPGWESNRGMTRQTLIQWDTDQQITTDITRRKIVKMLVERLTNHMKEKVLAVTCLQLAYLVMYKYDQRVLFATEGGVRAVLECMHEHQTSPAVQHGGLMVLKIITCVGGCELSGGSPCYTLKPLDAQVIKEIFSKIGSASGSSTSLLRAIPSAISKMLSTPGCVSALYNGLLIVRMLIENHKALAEQLSSSDLTSILQSFREITSDMQGPPHHQLELMVQLCLSKVQRRDVSQTVVLNDMDLQTLLVSLKDSKTCRELLPSLERCVCDGVSSLRYEVSEILTNTDFFLQLLSSLEQLRAEKCLQLSLFRILNKALDFHHAYVLPWHLSIEPSLTSIGSSSTDHEILQEVVSFLYRLASTNKDCAVVMCRLGTKETLSKVLEKQSSSLLQASELRDLLTDCEKYASLYQKMATSILAGCIQMLLGQIEDHRHNQQQIHIPFFDVFLRNLCQGSNWEDKEEKCWEKIEVSSNPNGVKKLTDGNPKSYWDSTGSSGSHYINIYMCRGVMIRQLVLTVASEDSSYMPAWLVVMGGESPSSINTELNSVNVTSTAGRVLLLENVTRFWPIIQIKIKSCQQGGINTRIRGLEILGPNPTFWPIFKEQLCQRTFLFYTSKAHSWGRKICEKKDRLLQLFTRLNRALSHEQDFAERFLTDQAAQTLGRTCWEALIVPVVQSITSPDDVGVSPLTWLFTKYLESKPVSGCRESSVFNSRVHKLTHLLVHMDATLPDTGTLKPPSKSNCRDCDSSCELESGAGSPRSSLAGIAQCWRGVVQQQVQRFLEISWNIPDMAPQFCSLYLSLRRSMEKLFGHQTLFLFSLRQGFCAGLLHMSFLRSLHVTEQFARYIDQRIQEIRSDSSDQRTMTRLQQFLEFVLFLSDLELANSFEHFYRHYLADRLLSLGPCWLENSVVDHIGICFPNRFPQQMLKNLQEAKDLQREQHLFSLQELDTGILSEDMEDREMSSDEPPAQDEESLVQVSVLSPRCWVVSPLYYMDNPHKHFSESLSGSLQRFANFYTKSQCALGSVMSSLQWTWFGNAEVQYSDLTLHVSTMQMFILLLFNQQQEVSIEDLIGCMGVSQSLLESALIPLTRERGILAVQKKGVLSLNKEYLTEAQSKVLHLLPRQMYINVQEDEGRAIERRRDAVLGLITQIMKKEKRLHIDNLVFRVIDAYQKKEPKFFLTSSSCRATDVLSCLMHQIRQGIICRNKHKPYLLHYGLRSPPPPPPRIALSPVKETVPVPPQVTEFCKVSKPVSNVVPFQESRPTFSTFRHIEKV
ncbi:cullin-9-like [Discoglossus pictus]